MGELAVVILKGCRWRVWNSQIALSAGSHSQTYMTGSELHPSFQLMSVLMWTLFSSSLAISD